MILELTTFLLINQNPLLQPPDPPKPVPAVVVTAEDNPQHCNEDTHWIASESPFYCIEKTSAGGQPLNKQQPSLSGLSSVYNTYQPGQCVWGVKEWRPEIPGNWGSAYQWVANAQAIGWPTGSIPRVNAVGAIGNHVVLVLAVYGPTVLIREMNYDWAPFHVREIEMPSDYYYYIY